MNPELKQKWIDALRSGNYAQGERRLRHLDNTFCCLGVLCDVAGLEWEKGPYEYKVSDGDVATPPLEFREIWGLESNKMWILIKMNDEDNKSFEEIADYVEENL